jgi:hypothetical protein
MPPVRRIVLPAVAATIGWAWPAFAGAVDLPAHPVPTGLHATAGHAGGRILAGPIGDVGSPAQAFAHGLTAIAPYFDRPPQIEGAVRSADGTLTVGLFRAMLKHQPVAGLELVAYGKNGGSRVAAIFDRPSDLERSLHPLVAQLTAMAPAVVAPQTAAVAQLHPMVSPDRSVRVGLPAGWTPKLFAQGQFYAVGPHAEQVDQEVGINFVDPRGSQYAQYVQMRERGMPAQLMGLPLQSTGDVAHDFVRALNALAAAQHSPDPHVTIEKATHVRDASNGGPAVAHVVGMQSIRGVRNRFVGYVAEFPPNSFGGWVLSVKSVMAPEDQFAQAFPTMLAIYNSYQVDQGVRQEQVQETIDTDAAGAARTSAYLQGVRDRNTAVFNASMSHAQAVQDGIDRSTAGFTRYLNDTTVLEHGPSGARATVDYNFADAIVQSDPQNFRVVPVSEYRRGGEY